MTGCLALRAIVSVLFDRAIAEPVYSNLYARLCSFLAGALPEFQDGTQTVNFRRILLIKCYEALVCVSEEQAVLSWRRKCLLGNVVFVGELFRRQLLTENIMHVCLSIMLDDEVAESFDALEAVCHLLRLVGGILDASSPASRRTMDDYFDMLRLSQNATNLPNRLKILMKETAELRQRGW